MKKRNSEFLGLLCDLYIVAMLVALPLYTGQGYWRLGDTKYTFFRNVTVLCLGCWLAAGRRRESPAVCGGEGPGRIGEDCPRSPEGLQHDGSGRGGLWRCRSAFGSVQLLRAASVEGV